MPPHDLYWLQMDQEALFVNLLCSNGPCTEESGAFLVRSNPGVEFAVGLE